MTKPFEGRFPTVGRILWYWEALPGGFNRPELLEDHMKTMQPTAAIVTFVNPDGLSVNVSRFSRDGISIPQVGVPLIQGDTAIPTHGGWAVWPDQNAEHGRARDELPPPAQAGTGTDASAKREEIERRDREAKDGDTATGHLNKNTAQGGEGAFNANVAQNAMAENADRRKAAENGLRARQEALRTGDVRTDASAQDAVKANYAATNEDGTDMRKNQEQVDRTTAEADATT